MVVPGQTLWRWPRWSPVTFVTIWAVDKLCVWPDPTRFTMAVAAELEHDCTATCWTNRKKCSGLNQCGMCGNARTQVTKGKLWVCKWCLTLEAWDLGNTLCEACIAEDDSLRRFTNKLYGTSGQIFLQSMKLPAGQPTKYRQWADPPPTAHPAASAVGQTAALGATPPEPQPQPAWSEVADLRRRVD